MRYLLFLLLLPLPATAQDGGIPDSGLCENCFAVVPNFDAWATTQVDAADAGRRQRRRPDVGSTAPLPVGGCDCNGTSSDWVALLGLIAFFKRRQRKSKDIHIQNQGVKR